VGVKIELDHGPINAPLMSALGQKQTFAAHQPMSALRPKADMCVALAYVKADIA